MWALPVWPTILQRGFIWDIKHFSLFLSSPVSRRDWAIKCELLREFECDITLTQRHNFLKRAATVTPVQRWRRWVTQAFVGNSNNIYTEYEKLKITLPVNSGVNSLINVHNDMKQDFQVDNIAWIIERDHYKILQCQYCWLCWEGLFLVSWCEPMCVQSL